MRRGRECVVFVVSCAIATLVVRSKMELVRLRNSEYILTDLML